MAKYLFTFYGGMMAETPEKQQKVMGAWMGWFGKLGKAVVDMGAPTMPGKSVGKSGITDISANPVTGYSVISAENLDAATTMAKGCPSIPDGGQVAVYELVEM